MRAFIAIDIPEVLHKSVRKFQSSLDRTQIFNASWTNQYHFTLKFLGNITVEKQLKNIIEKLEIISKRNSSFTAELKGISGFPYKISPRVIWIGIGEGSDRINALQKIINDEFIKLNFENETNYTNHLTLARVNAINNKPAWLDILKSNENRSFGKFKVSSIKLYESKLRQGRHVYEVIRDFNLA
ncbi:MAG: RNA 2',3'-cyclic phosphodiesterase [DPANN group archaeon]|nr:RNA 2',3'-cyclic phosphodiesterase [DPANN group archaeon]